MKAYFLDIVIPLATNITNKHADKIIRYFPLADEVKVI